MLKVIASYDMGCNNDIIHELVGKAHWIMLTLCVIYNMNDHFCEEKYFLHIKYWGCLLCAFYVSIELCMTNVANVTDHIRSKRLIGCKLRGCL